MMVGGCLMLLGFLFFRGAFFFFSVFACVGATFVRSYPKADLAHRVLLSLAWAWGW